MALRNAKPAYYIPQGLADSIDQTNSFSGACRALNNLVADRTDPQAYTGRPGAVVQVNFNTKPYAVIGAGNAGQIALIKIFDGFIVGFVQATGGAYAGKDVPFVYNLLTDVFNTWAVNPVVADCPATVAGLPVASGEVTSGALVGPTVYLTHPNFPATKFGYITAALTSGSMTFTVATTATNALPTRPTWVSQYQDRAWFACGTAAVFTDTLTLPPTVSNATQTLNANEGEQILGFHALSVYQTTGGILQALLSFGNVSVYQITGNYSAVAANNTLVKNQVSDAVSAVSMRTVDACPNGVAFMATDGVRIINQQGLLKYISEKSVDDLIQPFMNCTLLNRPAAVGNYQNGIYRVSLTTTFRGQVITGDFWYDYTRQHWNGPHSFTPNAAAGYNAKNYVSNLTFPGIIFVCELVPSATSAYLDNGNVPYNFDLITADFPLNAGMAEQAMVESTVELAQTTTTPIIVNVLAFDEQDNLLDQLSVTTSGQGPLWGGGTLWGTHLWKAASRNSKPYPLHWNRPLEFNKIYFEFQGLVVAGIGIKNQFYRFQELGYLIKSA